MYVYENTSRKLESRTLYLHKQVPLQNLDKTPTTSIVMVSTTINIATPLRFVQLGVSAKHEHNHWLMTVLRVQGGRRRPLVFILFSFDQLLAMARNLPVRKCNLTEK